MIVAIDHVVLAVTALDAAVTAYATLFGRPAAWRGTAGGEAQVWFALPGTAFVLVERAAPETPGLAALGFRVADVGEARRLLRRRGLRAGMEPRQRAGQGVTDVAVLDAADTHGVTMLLVAGADQLPATPATGSPADAVAGLDIAVLRTPQPERAVALFAGRLDLELTLDLAMPEGGGRLLVFACGDQMIEVVHDAKAGSGDGPDALWGLSWRADDIDALHGRLTAAGLAVSEVRPGRRAGTRVFTLRDRSVVVPTLIVGRA